MNIFESLLADRYFWGWIFGLISLTVASRLGLEPRIGLLAMIGIFFIGSLIWEIIFD